MYLTRFLLTKEIDKNLVLLINTLSGAVDLIKGKKKELLFRLQERNSKVLLGKEFEAKLKERGYLFDEEEDEKAIFNQLVGLFSKRPVSLPEFYLCYSYKCNLSCIYCNERHLSSKVKKNKAMQPEQLKAALNVISKIKKISRIEEKGVIILFGGEPLLPINRESIIRTFEFARRENFSIGIISNGILIEKFIGILSKHRDIIELIAISLDGPRSIHDQRRKAMNGSSFDQIVKGINILLSEGLKVEIRPIIDRQNISFLPDLANFMINQGWTDYKNFSTKIAKTMFPLERAKLSYSLIMPDSEFLIKLNGLSEKYPEMAIFGHKWLGDFEPFAFLREILNGEELVAPRLSGCKAVTPGMYIFGPDNLIYSCLELVGISQHATGRFYPTFEEFPTRERWKNFTTFSL